MGRRSRQTRVVSGGRTWHWYPIAAYLGFSVLGTAVALVMGATGDSGDVMAASGLLAMVWLVVMLGGLAILPALFRDAVSIRQRAMGWRPAWWYYLSAPFVLPGLAYFGADVAGLSEPLFAAMVVYLPTIFATHAHYLYQRHKFLGVP